MPGQEHIGSDDSSETVCPSAEAGAVPLQGSGCCERGLAKTWLHFLFGEPLLCRESGSPAVAMGKSNGCGSSELLCLPWVFSDALPCCDGASDMDVVDPYPMGVLLLVLGSAHLGTGSYRARAVARHMRANGALVQAQLHPQSRCRVTYRVAGMWEPRPPSLLVGLVEIRSFSERSCG